MNQSMNRYRRQMSLIAYELRDCRGAPVAKKYFKKLAAKAYRRLNKSLVREDG